MGSPVGVRRVFRERDERRGPRSTRAEKFFATPGGFWKWAMNLGGSTRPEGKTLFGFQLETRRIAARRVSTTKPFGDPSAVEPQ
jgi:hypothetical protein